MFNNDHAEPHSTKFRNQLLNSKKPSYLNNDKSLDKLQSRDGKTSLLFQQKYRQIQKTG